MLSNEEDAGSGNTKSSETCESNNENRNTQHGRAVGPDDDCQARLARALDIAGVATWEVHVPERTLTVDDYARTLLGIAPGGIPIPWSAISDWIHPEEQASFRSLCEKVAGGLADERPRFRVRVRQQQTGEWLWLEGAAVVFDRDSTGRPLHILGTCRDITAQLVAERRLLESEERYRRLVEVAPFLIGVHSQGKVVFVNQAGASMLGASHPDEIIGRPIMDFLPEERRDLAMQRIKAGLTSESQRTTPMWEQRLRRLDGQEIDVDVTGVHFSHEDGTALQLVIRDITESKRLAREREALQNELSQRQKLEAIGALARGIAHDFNNILCAILGYADLALREVDPSSELHGDIERIIAGGKRASALVHRILTFGRQNRQERKPIPVDPIVREALGLLRATLPSVIEIRERIAPSGCVVCDGVEVHQVVMNLCTNAALAMHATGGTLDVAVESMDVDATLAASHADLRPGRFVRLAVADTGCGIPSRDLHRIFEPLFSRRADKPGTGLGLSVVHGIVRALGGAIVVSSEVGRGSLFQVYLPEVPPAELGQDLDPETILPGTERILLVDDEEALVSLLRRCLGDCGYRVSGFTNSLWATDVFRQDPSAFDVVVSDITMPGLTGIQLSEEILRLRPDTPVILVTGYSDRVSDASAKELGVRAVLKKPLPVSLLTQAIRRALDGGR